MFGEETVEVSTFRARTATETDEHGRVLRTHLRHARGRRHPARLHDQRPVLRSGGRDPPRLPQRPEGPAAEIRAHHRRRARPLPGRPLRMLRAVRFAAKAGFSIDERTRKPIRELAHLLENVPPSRVYEECRSCCSRAMRRRACASCAAKACTTVCCPCSTSSSSSRWGALRHSRARADRQPRALGQIRVAAFLFAALLWHEVLAAWKKAQQRD